jgi:TRAP transporter TAXI family solute receptor
VQVRVSRGPTVNVSHPGLPDLLTRRRFLLAAAAVAFGGGAVAVLSRFSAPAMPHHLNLATGPKGAVYVEVGADIAKAVRGWSPDTSVNVQVTSATIENLHKLAVGESDLAFASVDAAALDSQVRTQTLTALGRVYDSSLHLVVRAESPISSLRDLVGRRVSVGAANSGTEFTSRRLMDCTGIEPSKVVRLGQTPAMEAVDDGTVDAAFSLTGCPTPAIADLARRRAIRLVPLAEFYGFLDREIPRAYALAPIPAGTYQGVGTATDTLLVPNVLLARPGLSDVAVALMMNALFDPRSGRYWVHPDSRAISLAMATVTGPVVLHPAARAWLDGHPT